ncbi:MAG: phosphopantetheine-binding protein [Myxococcales bacterium]|nr:phosphopantetheine-binding protein [Myxococcales bacterium]
MEQFEAKLKALIVEALVLEDVNPEEIESTEPLFVEGLGLDSIDALELAMAIEKAYGVSFSADDDENRAIFSSVRSLAQYIQAQQQAQNTAP